MVRCAEGRRAIAIVVACCSLLLLCPILWRPRNQKLFQTTEVAFLLRMPRCVWNGTRAHAISPSSSSPSSVVVDVPSLMVWGCYFRFFRSFFRFGGVVFSVAQVFFSSSRKRDFFLGGGVVFEGAPHRNGEFPLLCRPRRCAAGKYYSSLRVGENLPQQRIVCVCRCVCLAPYKTCRNFHSGQHPWPQTTTLYRFFFKLIFGPFFRARHTRMIRALRNGPSEPCASRRRRSAAYTIAPSTEAARVAIAAGVARARLSSSCLSRSRSPSAAPRSAAAAAATSGVGV